MNFNQRIENMKMLADIVCPILVEVNFLEQESTQSEKVTKLSRFLLPILPYVPWQKLKDEHEFKKHVETLTRNQLKLMKLGE